MGNRTGARLAQNRGSPCHRYSQPSSCRLSSCAPMGSTAALRRPWRRETGSDMAGSFLSISLAILPAKSSARMVYGRRHQVCASRFAARVGPTSSAPSVPHGKLSRPKTRAAHTPQTLAELSVTAPLYRPLFAIASSISASSFFACSADEIAPTMGSPTILPLLSTTQVVGYEYSLEVNSPASLSEPNQTFL